MIQSSLFSSEFSLAKEEHGLSLHNFEVSGLKILQVALGKIKFEWKFSEIEKLLVWTVKSNFTKEVLKLRWPMWWKELKLWQNGDPIPNSVDQKVLPTMLFHSNS